jgi:lysozyme family protein
MINFPRNATQHLQSLFAAFPVVVVTGARQVGKTTLLRQVFPNLDYVVFDAAVNSGPGRAAKWLQACVGVDPDGGIGPKTLQAVAAFEGDLVDDYGKRRLSFLMDLPHWPTFGKGWSRRVAEVGKVGADMA